MEFIIIFKAPATHNPPHIPYSPKNGPKSPFSWFFFKSYREAQKKFFRALK